MGLEEEGGSGSQGRGRGWTEGVAGGVVVAWGDGFEDLGWPQPELAVALHYLDRLYLKAFCVRQLYVDAEEVWWCHSVGYAERSGGSG